MLDCQAEPCNSFGLTLYDKAEELKRNGFFCLENGKWKHFNSLITESYPLTEAYEKLKEWQKKQWIKR
jgi:hypothetical protein